MRGAVLLEQDIAFREFPDPEPGPGQAVVRLQATTLCGSDLKLYHATREQRQSGRNTWGYIGGHELAGKAQSYKRTLRQWRPGAGRTRDRTLPLWREQG